MSNTETPAQAPLAPSHPIGPTMSQSPRPFAPMRPSTPTARRPRHTPLTTPPTLGRARLGTMLTVDDAALHLGLTPKAIRRQVERRRVPFRRLGRRIVFVRRELDEWVGTLPGVTLDEIRSLEEHRRA